MNSQVLLVFGVKVFGVIFATVIFAHFSPLVDSQLYLAGAYADAEHFRTRIINVIASALNSYFLPAIVHSIFAFFSIIGLVYLSLQRRLHVLLIILLLLPSSLVWTSVVGKEAIFVGAHTLLLVLWAQSVYEAPNKKNFLIIAFGFLVCGVLRPHYTLGVFWLYFSLFLFKTDIRYFVLVGIVAFATLLMMLNLFVWDELLLRGIASIDPDGRASRHDYFGLDLSAGVSTDFNMEIFRDALPLGLIFGIVGPMPHELFDRIEFLPFFIEGVIIVASPIFIGFFAVKKLTGLKAKRSFIKVLTFCIIPGIIIDSLVHAPFGLLNPGSAIRWRTNFEAIFYLAPLLLFLEVKRNRCI